MQWMDRICRLWTDDLKERCQDTIRIHLVTNIPDDLEEFGSLCWEDFTDCIRITNYYPPPDLQLDTIHWDVVGRYLVDKLKLQLLEPIDEDEEDED